MKDSFESHPAETTAEYLWGQAEHQDTKQRSVGSQVQTLRE